MKPAGSFPCPNVALNDSAIEGTGLGRLKYFMLFLKFVKYSNGGFLVFWADKIVL